MAGDTTRDRRWSFPRLQFSLRLALVGLTAFAIGFPIWYRWPCEEVVEQRTRKGAVASRRVSTWQRQWGGGRLLHGPETRQQGDLIQKTIYFRGKPHGPYQMTFKGKVRERGQYVNGMKEGVWTYEDEGSTFEDEGSKHTVSWRHDKLDGPYQGRSDSGKEFRFDFSEGRLRLVDGRPATNRLLNLLESGALDESDGDGAGYARVGKELRRLTTMEFVEQPLQDVVLYLQEQHNLPMILDTSAIRDPKLPITADHKGIDLCSGLTLLTAPYDLGCDFRYGMIWITTAKDADDWHDPTGVAGIEPPKGTALARAWNEPASLVAINQPIGTMLTELAQRLVIEIDTSQLPPSANQPLAPERPPSAPASPANMGSSNPFTITANLIGLPFRHVLGFAVYKANCRCRLDGDKLILLPPNPKP